MFLFFLPRSTWCVLVASLDHWRFWMAQKPGGVLGDAYRSHLATAVFLKKGQHSVFIGVPDSRGLISGFSGLWRYSFESGC